MDVQDGLSQNTINKIYEDKFGLLWVGTNDGLNRLEQNNIEIFHSEPAIECQLQSDIINDLEEDDENRLWIATYGSGINYYDYKKNCFRVLDINYKKNQHLINSIALDVAKNLIWVATDGGGFFSYDYHTNRKRNYDKFTDNKVSDIQFSIVRKVDNNIFAGSYTGNLILIDTTNNIKQVQKIANSKITSIKKYEDKLLISTELDGFFLFDYKLNIRFPYIKSPDGSDFKEKLICRSIERLDNNNFLLSTITGVYKLGLKEDTIFVLSSISKNNFDLEYDSFNNVKVDSKGTIWYGSNGFGLFYDSPNFKYFNKLSKSEVEPSLSFSSIKALFQYDSTLMVGGFGGLNKFNLKSKKVEIVNFEEQIESNEKWNNTIPSKSIYCFHQDPKDSDIIWIGSELDGLIKYSKLQQKFYFVKISQNLDAIDKFKSVYTIDSDDDYIVLGTDIGLFVFEQNSELFSYFKVVNEKFTRRNLSVKSMFLDNGKLYHIIDGLGIYIYDFETTELISIEEKFPKYDSQLFKNANSIRKYKHLIYLSSKEYGLLILDIKKGTIEKYDIKSGLSNNCVYEVINDRNKYLWLSTNKGLSRINLQNSSITNFNSKIFNLNTEYNQNAVLFNNKNFYFGGIEGLDYFNPINFDKVDNQSEFIIKSIELNKDSKIEYFYFIESDTITVDYIDDLIEINIITNDFLFDNLSYYRYRLNDDDFIYSLDNKINLVGLVEGINKIEIYTKSKERKIKTFYINVQKPFWTSLWFIILALLLVGILIFYFYNLKMRQLSRKLKSEYKKVNSLKKANTELESNFNLLDENISNLVWLVDNDFNFIFKSSNIKKYYNLNDEKQIKNLSDLYIEDDLQRLKNEFMANNQFRKSIETKMFLKRGANINEDFSEVKLIKNLDVKGKLESITGIIKDTQEQSRAERQLKEREELFSTLVGNILEPVIITSWEGEFLFANVEAKNLLKLNEQDIPEKKLFDFLDDPMHHDLRKKVYIVKTGDTFEKVLFELQVDGKTITIEGSGTKIIYYQRSVFLLTFRDVTERINLIKELTTAKINAEQTSELKTMYLSNLTHELKTPINAISGFTDILLSKSSDEFNISYLNSIKSGTNLLLQLINDLLFYSKAESRKLEIRPVPTNLKSLVSEIENIFSIELKKKNLTFKTEIISNGINQLLNVDQLKYKQIIINLLNNAIKYTQEGTIRLRLTIIKVDNNQVNLVLDIEDSGKGIPNSKLAEIFTAFRQVNFTDQHDGFGLGLAIVKRIVDSMEGEINVTSEIGKGSIFSVKLKNINLVLKNAKSRKPKEEKNIVETFIRRDNKLNIYSKETLQLISTSMNGKFSIMLKNIKGNFLLKDISEFAEELNSMAEEFGIDFIISYSEELINATKTIDVEKISELLENFYKLVDIIEKLLKNIKENEQR